MRRTLFIKILGSYLLFAICALVLLETFTDNIAQSYLLQAETNRLYRESTILAPDFRNLFNSKEEEEGAMQEKLETIGECLAAEIHILDSSGIMLWDSTDLFVAKQVRGGNPIRIEEFDISDFGNSYHQVGSFYNHFSEDTLTVFAPITVDYKVRGYVFIHKPVSAILRDSGSIVNMVFYTAAAIFSCSLILLLAVIIIVCRPVRRMTKVASLYAKGEFQHQIPVRKNDEIGYIAHTMNYMAEELDTLEDEQRKFISNVSHDFRSPLTSIKGYIEAMLDGTIPPEMQEKYLNIILFETERLNKLTQSVLDLNQFGHQGMSLDISDFDINRMIRTTIMTFEGTCSKKGLTFDLILTEQQLFVRADSGKIQQVLYNLIDNATKFSHSNSAITIETNVKNGKVFISVKDRGIGIPSDSLKRIWERFYKTDQSRGKDKKGTGLGLAIVKEIIQAHNENINVISTEEVGTEFIFTLPLAEKER